MQKKIVLTPQFDIFNIKNQKEFEKMALKIFRFQHENNKVYKEFCDFLKISTADIKSLNQIPFLPIQFFKSHKIVSNQNQIQEIFISSGTTQTTTSQHFVTDLTLYENSFQKGFSQFYGNIEDFVLLALLPSYLDRKGSSLIYMVENLIAKTKNNDSGFYLFNPDELIQKMLYLEKKEQNCILIGVTYALLDLIEKHKFDLKNTIIMETGGMKGKRKEMIREDLHSQLCKGFGIKNIHSEYGMTELLSQAYSLGNGVFECPNWMQVLIRDPQDARSYVSNHKTGGINVIDLANINSCSFIATQDLGKKLDQHTFEVIGRFDDADIRGCNLLTL